MIWVPMVPVLPVMRLLMVKTPQLGEEKDTCSIFAEETP
jgi:hypothetical protein